MAIELKKQMSSINIDKNTELENDSKGSNGGDTLYSQSWLNIVFKGRNTEYGAYQLRKNYAKNAIIGFVIACSVFAFSTSLPLLFNEKQHAKTVTILPKSKKLEQPKELNKDKPLPPPPPTPPPPEIKTIKVLPPKVEPDEKVVEDPPTKEDMQKTAIGKENKEGADDPNGNVTGTNDKLPEPDPVQEPPKEEKVELIVDEEAKPNVNHNLFFQKNYSNPRLAQANSVSGKFIIRLTIDKDGKIADKKIIDQKKVDIIDKSTGESYGIVKELNRMVELMSKEGFQPAKKGGKPVKSILQIPFILSVSE